MGNISQESSHYLGGNEWPYDHLLTRFIIQCIYVAGIIYPTSKPASLITLISSTLCRVHIYSTPQVACHSNGNHNIMPFSIILCHFHLEKKFLAIIIEEGII